jgi:hypothetical protein
VIFNEREFYNRKPVRVSQELLTSLDETIEQIALPERESLKEVQFQAEEALEIGEGEEPEEAIENLRDIKDLDNQSLGEDDNNNDNESIALPLRQDGYPTPPLLEKLVQFLENDIIALLSQNISSKSRRARITKPRGSRPRSNRRDRASLFA